MFVWTRRYAMLQRRKKAREARKTRVSCWLIDWLAASSSVCLLDDGVGWRSSHINNLAHRCHNISHTHPLYSLICCLNPSRARLHVCVKLCTMGRRRRRRRRKPLFLGWKRKHGRTDVGRVDAALTQPNLLQRRRHHLCEMGEREGGRLK